MLKATQNISTKNLTSSNVLSNISFINTDVAVPGLNRDFAHSSKILVPKKVILQEFERVQQSLFEQISTIKKYNIRLSETRDLLLPKLMNGEVAV